MVLEESPSKSDQATSDASLGYDEFELSCDEYIAIFNELKRCTTATHCFDVLRKIFSSSSIFKKRGVLSTFGIFKPKGGKRHATLMSMNFSHEYLRENLF